MKFTVTVKRRVLKGIKKMPEKSKSDSPFLSRPWLKTAQRNLHGQTASSPSPNITVI